MEQTSAIDFLNKNSLLYLNLWEKVNENNKQVRQMALQCFVTLSQKLGPSTMLIVKTATNFARRNNRSPFTELVHSLNLKWDVETRFYALQLINSLIVRCPSEKKIAQFVARLENIGLYDELRSLSQIKDHPKIRLQLQNFQVSTKQLLPSLAFENEVHKCRLKQ